MESSSNNTIPSFEGAGAIVIFKYKTEERAIFAMRNPDYISNDKKIDECEYPGGKVDPGDYTSTSSHEDGYTHVPRNTTAREWDEEVFSSLSDKDRKECNVLFQSFLNNASYVDVQGAKAKIRLYAIYLNIKCGHNSEDRLFAYLKKSDRALESMYQSSKSDVPLRGLVHVRMKELVHTLDIISSNIDKFSSNVMKDVGVHCNNNKLLFEYLDERNENQTVYRSIRKFNFFTLYELTKEVDLQPKNHII